MRAVVAAVLALGSVVARSGTAEPVQATGDEFLIRLLNGFRIVKEADTAGFGWRALHLREHGECDGRPDTCPKLRFFLAVSAHDEYPDQAVYELPASLDWEITKVSAID